MTKKEYLKTNTSFVIDINKALIIKVTKTLKENLALLGYKNIIIMDCITGKVFNNIDITLN
jgi:hypothetical protein